MDVQPKAMSMDEAAPQEGPGFIHFDLGLLGERWREAQQASRRGQERQSSASSFHAASLEVRPAGGPRCNVFSVIMRHVPTLDKCCDVIAVRLFVDQGSTDLGRVVMMTWDALAGRQDRREYWAGRSQSRRGAGEDLQQSIVPGASHPRPVQSGLHSCAPRAGPLHHRSARLGRKVQL